MAKERSNRMEYFDNGIWVVSTAGYKPHSSRLNETFKEARLVSEGLARTYEMLYRESAVTISEGRNRFVIKTKGTGKYAYPFSWGKYRRVIIDVANLDRETALSVLDDISNRIDISHQFDQRKIYLCWFMAEQRMQACAEAYRQRHQMNR